MLTRREIRYHRAPLVAAATAIAVALVVASWPGSSAPIAPAVCEAATVAATGTTVVPYSPGCAERYAAEGKKTVLFFRAYWCGNCAEAAAEIAEEAPDGPADLAIVEVDFDAAHDLRARYGVTIQHTFVQVDGAGEPLGKWVGGDTLEEIYARLR